MVASWSGQHKRQHGCWSQERNWHGANKWRTGSAILGAYLDHLTLHNTGPQRISFRSHYHSTEIPQTLRHTQPCRKICRITWTGPARENFLDLSCTFLLSNTSRSLDFISFLGASNFLLFWFLSACKRAGDRRYSFFPSLSSRRASTISYQSKEKPEHLEKAFSNLCICIGQPELQHPLCCHQFFP